MSNRDFQIGLSEEVRDDRRGASIVVSDYGAHLSPYRQFVDAVHKRAGLTKSEISDTTLLGQVCARQYVVPTFRSA
jgi:hypothetical protein